MKHHPAADLFPMLEGDRLAGLVESMKRHGYDRTKPIVRYQGWILDGRNRESAAKLAGVEPVYVDLSDTVDPYLESWKHNGDRRDLEPDTRCAIKIKINEGSDEWEAARQRERGAANRARSETQAGRPKQQRDVSRDTPRSDPAPRHPAQKPAPAKTAGSLDARALAAETGTSVATASRVLQLKTKAPEKFEAVARSEMKATEALRTIKREEVTKCAEWPSGKYRVVYADPPWKYGDERTGVAGFEGTAAADHYPTMPTDDICALDVKALALDDAVLFCWATFPLLPDALRVVKAWGFSYKTAFVWSKGRGAFGHYHRADAELLLVAVRGSCQPETSELQQQVQEVKRDGKHSTKPEHFRNLIDLLYPSGPRIELFRRGDTPKGWTVWGNEAAA